MEIEKIEEERYRVTKSYRDLFIWKRIYWNLFNKIEFLEEKNTNI